MPSTCEFSFNKEPPVYYAGEDAVVGSIALTTTTEKEVYVLNYLMIATITSTVRRIDVCVYFRGSIKCGCNILANIFKCAPPCFIQKCGYSSGETILNERRMFFGEGTFPPQKRNFAFNLNIPEGCPTSLECKYSQIRYELCLVINNKEKYKNVFIKPITVIKRQNLNIYPYLLERQLNLKHLYTWCGLVKRPLFISVQTPIGAYAPGQTLRYTIESNNKCPEEMLGYNVQFARITRSGSKVCKSIIYEINIPDNDQYTQITNGEIIIPSTPPSMNLRNIKVRYDLRVKAKHALKRHNLHASVQIIICTSPLHRSTSEQQVAEPISRAHIFEAAHQYETPFVDYRVPKINQVDFQPFYPIYKTIEPSNV